jgi:periplasmic copper chaperone A
MFRRSFTVAAVLSAALLAIPAVAHHHTPDPIAVVDAELRTTGAMARSGAAFMVIENRTDAPDRLIAARSDLAARVELHTHREDAAGVMRMVEVPEGFVIPAFGSHALARGGDHVMFLGLTRVPEPGERVRVTLVFETAGEIEVEIPVAGAQPAMPAHGHGHSHGHN